MASDNRTGSEPHQLWRQFVNPDYVALLESFDFGRHFTWAEGTKLRDAQGREYTDFLAGFGVHNLGHNHPTVVRRLAEELGRSGPSMLNVDAPLPAGQLAEQLCHLTHSALCRAVFASGGAEAVEVAIKVARAATGRNGLLACRACWHGLSTGALALMDDEEHRHRFGPLLPDVAHVPFGDAAALEEACARHRPAGFFVEPIQGEGGIRIPPADYLNAAAAICRKAGCLLIVDEIQTGLGRTGRMFATDFAQTLPDVLLIGKALSGGLVPAAVCLMTAETHHKALAGPRRCNLCASTFGGGRLATTAALAVLDVLQTERLPQQAADRGDQLLDGLAQLADRHAAIAHVRGRGLLAGIEFAEPSGLVAAAVPRWARRQLLPQVVAAVLLRDHGLLTQTCGLAPNVLRIEPPLVISQQEIGALLDALDQVLAAYPSFRAATWSAFRKTALGRDL